MIDPAEKLYLMEERAAIFEYEAGMSREDAEEKAVEWMEDMEEEE